MKNVILNQISFEKKNYSSFLIKNKSKNFKFPLCLNIKLRKKI